MLPDEDSAREAFVVVLIRVLVELPVITLTTEVIGEHVPLGVAVLEIRCELAVASNAEFDLRAPTTGES